MKKMYTGVPNVPGSEGTGSFPVNRMKNLKAGSAGFCRWIRGFSRFLAIAVFSTVLALGASAAGQVINLGTACFTSSTNPPDPRVSAQMTWTINADNTVTIRTTLAKTFVDNTYGTGVIGWPSGHKFSELTGSDHLQLALYDANNVKKMEFRMDYLTASTAAPSGYKSLGVTGGEGDMIVGNATDVLGVVTSLDKNFNSYGYVLITNSPSTNANYAPNQSYPNWIYDVWYEVTVRMSVFGTSGFGQGAITGVHASPSKTGSNSEPVTKTTCPVLTASITAISETCISARNGSIDLTVNYGDLPYSYLWSNGATTQDLVNLAPGTYSVTVTDAAGTKAYASAVITQSSMPCSGILCFSSSAVPPNPNVGARMSWTINADNTITIRTILSKTFVDNTYGTGVIGWPSGHKFGDLVGSDHLQLAVYDANNVKRGEFKMDYITASSAASSGYKSLGVTGGEGNMLFGDESDVVSVVTSLDRNFNTYNYILTTNSPSTNTAYLPNSSYPNWIFDVWYEVTLKMSMFGTSGFGKGLISGVHASPSKTGNNTEPVTPSPCPVPVPPTAIVTQPTCVMTTGTITVTSPLGATYEYSKNGTTWQTSTVFSGLPANTSYTISVRNITEPGFVSIAQFVINSVPSAPPPPQATLIQPTCAVPTGSITVTSPTGATYEYSKNGAVWQTSTLFSGLPPNVTYTIYVRNTATDPGCISSATFIIKPVPNAPTPPQAILIQPTCAVPTGTITITSPVGPSYEYSKDGMTVQTSPVFSGLAANTTYIIYVRNIAADPSCISSSRFVISAVPNAPAAPQATLVQPTCAVPTGTITVTSPTGATYEYSRNGSVWQTSTVFGSLPANSTYTIFVRNVAIDPGCISSTTFLINQVPNSPATPLATVTQPTCAIPTGTITVTAPTGATYEYSKNGTTWQASPVFGSLPGYVTYTIYVRNLATDPGCVSSAPFTVNLVPAAPSMPLATVIQPTCAIPTGTITVTSPTGAAFEYSKNGTSWQISPVFSDLAGNATYTIYVRNIAIDPGCISSATFVINPAPNAPAPPQAILIQPTCSLPTGTITVTSPTGATYEYSKNGTVWQLSTVFSGLAANATYTIYVRNLATGCISSAPFVIRPVPNLPATPMATVIQPTCSVPTGTITVTSPTGPGYQYSKDGMTVQTSPVFSGLAPNTTYTIYVRNIDTDPGCISSARFVIGTVPTVPAIPLAILIQPTCAMPTGTITITAPLGETYEYSKNGINWQTSPVFSNLAGNMIYTIYVRNTATDPECISAAQFIICAVPGIPAIPIATLIQPTCVVPTGTITVISPTGPTFEYSKNGTTWQTSTVFSGLAPNATYTIYVRNTTIDPGCISSALFVIGSVSDAPASPLAILTQPTCAIPTGTITVTSPVGPLYEYSKDGVTVQSSPVFSGLTANTTYTIYVRHITTRCISSARFVIGPVPNAPATPLATVIQPTCAVPTGTITVTSPTGASYEYSKNGTTWQTSTVFSGLAANASYTIYVRNTATDPGCISSAIFVINQVPNAPATPLATLIQPTCSLPTGTITVTSPTGPGYEYSKDGMTVQTSPVFSGLAANTTYTIWVRNVLTDPKCIASASFVIGQIPNAPATPLATVIQPTCAVPTGTITVTSPTGVTYEYSKNGSTWQMSSVFSGLAGNASYTIYVRNTATDPGCISSAIFVINQAPDTPATPLATVTQPTCAVPFGTITVTSPTGETYEYSQNGSTWQTSTVFGGLTANTTYTIYVRNTATDPDCISSSSFIVNLVPNAPAIPLATVIQPTCSVPTGTITVTSPTGASYEYSINGTTWQTSTLFSGLAGNSTYTIYVRNSSIDPGCISTAQFTIGSVPNAPPAPLATLIQPTCAVPTGTITITSPTGPSYEYSIDGVTVQSSPVFSGLAANTTYKIYLRNKATDPACISSGRFVIGPIPNIPSAPLATVTQPTCSIPTGTITVTSPTGASYEYSKNGTSWQTSTVFSGLAANATYTIYVRNTASDPGCTNSAPFVIIAVPQAPAVPLATIIQPTGTVQTGTITVTSPVGGTYQYSKNGTTWQTSPVFSGLPGNATYTIYVRNMATDPTCVSYGTFVINLISITTQCFSSGETPPDPRVGARMTWTINADNTVTIRTTLAKTFVDNTYGTNAIGWPSGHKFDNLVGSDQLQLALYDANNVKRSEVKMDYITASSAAPSGYKSLGVAGGDGNMIFGNESDVISVVTSLDENFNKFGYVLTTNSPSTNANYAPNPSYPNWIYEVWYEVTLKLSAFGTSGFGKGLITGIHASPSKTGSNTEIVIPTPCVDLTVLVAVTNQSCSTANDGSIDLTVTDGVQPYTYLWSNGATTQDISNLAPGSYSVTITDAAGSIATANAVLMGSTVPCTVITAIVAVTNVTCSTASNGSADLTVTNGVQPYTYVWSNGATTQDLVNLAPGTYNVTVTDATGATATASAVIMGSTVPCPVLTAIVAATNVSCILAQDGSVNLTVTNGVQPYTYSWSNGATTQDLINLTPGTYNVTVTDATGATATASAVVLGSTAPCTGLTVIVAVTNETCASAFNGTVDLTVINGVQPITYLWSNGATTQDLTNLAPGTYNVTVTDAAGATATASAVIMASGIPCSGTQCFSSASTPANPNVNAELTWIFNSDNTITIRTTLAKTWVDNTYGTNAVGWPSGHQFSDLTGSDQLQLALYDANYVKKIEFKMDYFTASTAAPSGYKSLGVTGGDGAMLFGNASDVVGVTTSMDKNFNTYGYIFTSNSPATDNNYTPNPSYPNWIYEVWYEVTVKTSLFGTPGIGKALISGVHASPGKTGNDSESLIKTPCVVFCGILAVTNETCMSAGDGSIDLTVISGVQPYTYLWSNGATTQDISDLTPGVYSVLITDATGATATASGVVLGSTVPCTVLTALVAVTNVTCISANDGAADLTVTNGIQPYSYVWSNGATTQDLTNLAPGTYNVTVTDAKGTTATASAVVMGSAVQCPGTQCFSSTATPPNPNVGAQLTWVVNADNTITIRTTLARTFVDNTYGTSRIGWPGDHKFGDLVGSDQLQLALYDGNNVKRIEFKMDYLTASSAAPSGYKSLGVTGGDGNMILGNESDVVGVVTSLDKNFNTYGYILTTNSPATDINYTPNSAYPNWIFDVWYEVKVKMSVFGTSGFGQALIPGIHASPSKTGKNTEPVGPCVIFTGESLNKSAIAGIGNTITTDKPAVDEPSIDLKVYPNPSRGPVTFEFTVSIDADVAIDIYSLSGQRIARIFDADVEAGVNQTVVFDKSMVTGTYLYILRWNNEIVTGKVILAR